MRYEKYLYSDNAETHAAYLEGCRNILTIFRATPAAEYPKLWGSLTDEHITKIIIEAERTRAQQRLLDCEAILQTLRYNDNQISAFLHNAAYINDDGVMVDMYGKEAEDYMYRQKAGCALPWLETSIHHGIDAIRVAMDKCSIVGPGRTPSPDNPNVLCLQRLNGRGALKITSNDEDYMKMLIQHDLVAASNHDCALRYLIAIQQGKALERYADFVGEELANNAIFGIDPMTLTYALSQHAQRPEHIFLHYLLAIQRSVRVEHFMFYGSRMARFFAHLVEATDNNKCGRTMFDCMFSRVSLETFYSITGEPITKYLISNMPEGTKISFDAVPGLVRTKLIKNAARRIIMLFEHMIKTGGSGPDMQSLQDIYDLSKVILLQTTTAEERKNCTDPAIDKTIFVEAAEKSFRQKLAEGILSRYNIEIHIESTLLG